MWPPQRSSHKRQARWKTPTPNLQPCPTKHPTTHKVTRPHAHRVNFRPRTHPTAGRLHTSAAPQGGEIKEERKDCNWILMVRNKKKKMGMCQNIINNKILFPTISSVLQTKRKGLWIKHLVGSEYILYFYFAFSLLCIWNFLSSSRLLFIACTVADISWWFFCLCCGL